MWVARFYEDIIKPDGVLRRIRRSEVIGTVTEFRTRGDAMQELSKRLNPINTGKYRPQSTKKLRDFVRGDWEPVVVPTLKYSTQQQYAYLLNLHILPAFGERRLCTLERREIQDFLAAKLRSRLSWKTVSLLRMLFGRVLGSAEKWGYITGNPARLTELPRRTYTKQIAVLSPEQIQQLAESLREPIRSLALLLVLTGLRIGELLALRWKNLDLSQALLRIRETVYDGHFDEPKTKRSCREIPLGPETVGILAALYGKGIHLDALVFAGRTGKPLDRRNLLRREIEPVCKRVGLPRISWHSFRHCHATLLDGVGAPLGTVQALLGHASSKVTRQVYLHAIPSEQRRAVEALEQLVIGPKWTQVDEPQEKGKFVIN